MMNKLNYLLLLFLFAGLNSSLFAQTGSIEGSIQSEEGTPVAYVNVILKGTDKGATTNDKGVYRIKNIPEGSYTLIASFLGLKRENIDVDVQAGETTQVSEITLQVSEEQLREIVVRGQEDTYLADVPSRSLRIDGPLNKTPQNIQVLTEEVIRDQQSLDMLENVARNVSGAQMIEHWGTFARVNMRGFKIPAFRNGMNVELPWGPLTEDIAIVDRIEFVKGPAGFMLSSGEPGGLYNVVTKKPSLYHENEVSLTTGSFNTLRATLDYGGEMDDNGKLLYRVNIMGSTKGSHRDYEFNNRYTIAPSIKYQLTDRTSITAEYIYQYSQMSLIGATYVFSGQEFGDLPRDFTFAEPNIDPSNIREHNIFVDLNHAINNNWSVTAKIGYLNYEQVGSSLWVNSVEENGDAERTLSTFDAFNESKLGQLYINGNLQTGSIEHAILAGVDLGQKDYYADWWQGGVMGAGQTFNIYDPQYGLSADQIPEFDRSQSIRKRATSGSYPALVGQRYSSLYVQDQITFFDRARLTIGGRYTEYNGWSYGATTNDQVITPRIGLNVSVGANVNIYGLYDQSFIPTSGTTVEGEAFVPVRANNLEGGLKKDWFGGRWKSTVAVFHITKENMVVAHPDPDVLEQNPYAQMQLGEAVSKGVELDIQGEIIDGLQLILNYANTNVEITEDTNEENEGTRIPGHAEHMANTWLHYRFQDNLLNGFGVSLGAQYQHDRSSWNWDADNESLLPDYFRLDGAFSYENEDFHIGLNINNLLDEYLYSGSAYSSFYYWQTEPGINYRLNVRYKF